jgi:hypothetical protein
MVLVKKKHENNHNTNPTQHNTKSGTYRQFYAGLGLASEEISLETDGMRVYLGRFVESLVAYAQCPS